MRSAIQQRPGRRRAAHTLASGLAVVCLMALPACLEKQGDSEITIGGSYGGVGGEGAASGPVKLGDVDSIPDGDASGAEHAAVSHEEKPPGFGADAKEAPEAPPQPAGGDPLPEGDGAMGTPKPVPHEDKAHTEHTHVDRPAGFGQDGGAEPEPAPPGSPGGSADGELPQIASPFEREYEGKPMVVVSGTLSVADDLSGVADIDCFVPDDTSPAKRKFVNKVKARAPGTFKMKVPADYGKLILAAFLDIEGDGPDPADPQGSYAGELNIGDEDIDGVDIVLGAGQAPPPN